MEIESGIEIIDFSRPDDSSKKLYVANLTESVETEPSIQEKLQAAFAKEGLLYEVCIILAEGAGGRESVPKPGDEVYAFVTFYSSRDALRAKRTLTGKLFINGQLVTIKLVRRKNPIATPPTLYIAKCYELANHFLGFNRWTSNILKMNAEVDQGDPQLSSVKVHCVAQIKLTVDNLHAEGAAIAQQPFTASDTCSKGVAMCRAKKQAHQQALQDAFSKILLVRLPDGRIHVEVNTTIEERLNFDDELDKKSMLKVKECSTAPVVDSDEEQAMDDVNMDILQQLESSGFEDS